MSQFVIILISDRVPPIVRQVISLHTVSYHLTCIIVPPPSLTGFIWNWKDWLIWTMSLVWLLQWLVYIFYNRIVYYISAIFQHNFSPYFDGFCDQHFPCWINLLKCNIWYFLHSLWGCAGPSGADNNRKLMWPTITDQ